MSAISPVSSGGAISQADASEAAISYPMSPGLPLSVAAVTLAKGEKAARDFEAQLIGTVLQSLEKTFAALPGNGSISGEDDYNYLGAQALASGLAAHGGFGIARMISEYLNRTKVPSPAVAEPEANSEFISTKVSLSSTDRRR